MQDSAMDLVSLLEAIVLILSAASLCHRYMYVVIGVHRLCAALYSALSVLSHAPFPLDESVQETGTQVHLEHPIQETETQVHLRHPVQETETQVHLEHPIQETETQVHLEHPIQETETQVHLEHQYKKQGLEFTYDTLYKRQLYKIKLQKR